MNRLYELGYRKNSIRNWPSTCVSEEVYKEVNYHVRIQVSDTLRDSSNIRMFCQIEDSVKRHVKGVKENEG